MMQSRFEQGWQRELIQAQLDAAKEEKDDYLIKNLENMVKANIVSKEEFKHNYMIDVINNLSEINKALNGIHTELKRMRRK